MASIPNPYQSPASVDTGNHTDESTTSVIDVVPRRWYDKLTLFMVSVASGLYFAFIAVLLDYGSLDRLVGMIFLVNVPVLVIWIVQLLRHRPVSYGYGFVAASTQLVIMLVMISIGLSNQSVVTTNLAIASGFGLLGLQCRFVFRIAKITSANSLPLQ